MLNLLNKAMSAHGYTAAQALEVLLRKLSERDPDLAQHVRYAIDAGKDVEERERFPGHKKLRVYRKVVRLTDEEALQVALNALQAYFVEQPLFVNSAAENFRSAAFSAPLRGPLWDGYRREADALRHPAQAQRSPPFPRNRLLLRPNPAPPSSSRSSNSGMWWSSRTSGATWPGGIDGAACDVLGGFEVEVVESLAVERQLFLGSSR